MLSLLGHVGISQNPGKAKPSQDIWGSLTLILIGVR